MPESRGSTSKVRFPADENHTVKRKELNGEFVAQEKSCFEKGNGRLNFQNGTQLRQKS